MNSNFNYTGRVTIKSMFKGKTTHTQYLNNGTDLLFESYARALAGQNIYELLPSYINLYYEDGGGTYKSLIKNLKGSPVIRNIETTEIGDDSYLTTRISTSITREMLTFTGVSSDNVPIKLRLLTDDLINSTDTNTRQGILAEVSVDNSEEFMETLKTTPSGVQLIIVWDLFITNNEGGEN